MVLTEQPAARAFALWLHWEQGHGDTERGDDPN